MSPQQHTVFFAKEVAELLRTNERTVQELHRAGRLPAVRHMRPLRWTRQSVENFLCLNAK